jgi:hypothetical protein
VGAARSLTRAGTEKRKKFKLDLHQIIITNQHTNCSPSTYPTSQCRPANRSSASALSHNGILRSSRSPNAGTNPQPGATRSSSHSPKHPPTRPTARVQHSFSTPRPARQMYTTPRSNSCLKTTSAATCTPQPCTTHPPPPTVGTPPPSPRPAHPYTRLRTSLPGPAPRYLRPCACRTRKSTT